MDLVQRGLPFKAISNLASKSGLTIAEIASIIELPVRTLARRRSAGKLSRDESERLLRLATVFDEALELFEGETSEAVAWLKSPVKALSNQTPLDYARYEVGAREVEELIGRLEHGVFS